MPKSKPAPVLAPDPDPCLGAGDDHLCADPLPDGWCVDCGLGPETHESSELGLSRPARWPWCGAKWCEDGQHRRLSCLGTWAWRFDRSWSVEEDAGSGMKRLFKVCTLGHGSRGRRTSSWPSVHTFLGSARCAPTGEVATVDPVAGLRLGSRVVAEPVLPRLPFAALRAAYRAAFGRIRCGGGRKTDPQRAQRDAYDRERWTKAVRGQVPPMSALQLSTLLGVYEHAGPDLDAMLPRIRYGITEEATAARAAAYEAHAVYCRGLWSVRRGLWSVRYHAGLPHSPGVGGSARGGGPAVARALRARGLLDGSNHITPEGRALVEHAAPALAVVAFLVQVGQPWSRIRRVA